MFVCELSGCGFECSCSHLMMWEFVKSGVYNNSKYNSICKIGLHKSSYRH